MKIEPKIGEVFTVPGLSGKFICEIGSDCCDNCDFILFSTHCYKMVCGKADRKDKTNVKFIKHERD